MAERCAVLGGGQTHHRRVRDDVSIAGMLREAAERALADADMDWSDVDAVVTGKAPDPFEGIMMPELYLTDALGGTGKPNIRVHTAGSVGGSTAVVASHLISSGVHERVLTISWEKQSEGDTTWGLSGGRSGGTGAGGAFAPYMLRYRENSGAPENTGFRVALKDRRNALKNEYAHLKLANLTEEAIKESPLLWYPVHRLESCPTSDGAACMILGNEKAARAHSKPVAWVRGTAVRSELGQFPGRDPVDPQAGRDCAADVYRQAGISDPRKDLDCVECYVPFSWYEPMWLENLHLAPKNEGWKLTMDGVTELDGDLPLNMSGGVLSTNPIGASGMLRFLEASMQVRGVAGEHQVDGASLALGHAYGGNAQYFAMWVVGSDPD